MNFLCTSVFKCTIHLEGYSILKKDSIETIPEKNINRCYVLWFSDKYVTFKGDHHKKSSFKFQGKSLF